MTWRSVLLSAGVAGGVTFAADGGTSSPAPADAGPSAQAPRWVSADGGVLRDGGVTDLLTVRVGETAEVRLPHPIILMQCDEPLLSLEATETSLLLTGLEKGHTACGFWFWRQAFPHRYMAVTVVGR